MPVEIDDGHDKVPADLAECYPDEIEVTVVGSFPDRSIDDVMEVVVDALHDWLNPGWQEGDECVCSFAAAGKPAEDDHYLELLHAAREVAREEGAASPELVELWKVLDEIKVDWRDDRR